MIVNYYPVGEWWCGMCGTRWDSHSSGTGCHKVWMEGLVPSPVETRTFLPPAKKTKDTFLKCPRCNSRLYPGHDCVPLKQRR